MTRSRKVTDGERSGGGAAPVSLEPDALRALHDRDPKVIEATLREVAPAVVRLARGMLGERHPDLDDAIQESLIAIGNALPAFAGQSTVTRYAIRIASRHVLRAARRAHRRWGPVDGAVDPDQLTGGHPPSAAPSEAAERRRALLDLLSRLPDNQAEAIVLRGFFGLTLDEVAREVGRPANTVRSRVRLARDAIRAHLSQDPDLAAILRDD